MIKHKLYIASWNPSLPRKKKMWMRVYLQLIESFSDVSFQIYRGDLAAKLVSWASVLFGALSVSVSLVT